MLSPKRHGVIAHLAAVTAVPSALAFAALVCAPGCTVTTTDEPISRFDGGVSDLDEDGGVCSQCQYDACQTQWTTCVRDTICKQIYDCAIAPGCDQACVNRCFTLADNETSQAEYLAITQCQASAVCNGCAATCGTNTATCTYDAGVPDTYVPPVDSGVPDTGTPDTGALDAAPVSACDQCKADFCSAQSAKCQAGSACKQLGDCKIACANGTGDFTTCDNGCGASYPSGAAPLADLGTCTNANCTTPCSQ